MMKEYTYYAFISYKREDESWAKWLQERLEYYKLPNANADNQAEYIRPVFRDITDLRPGLLSERIKEALDNSKYLIAICSTRYSKSIWCDAEIHRFIETGKAKQIIPFIIDGIPYSDDQECFPPSLRSLRGGESELLGADIRPISRDYAFIQVVASMLDVNVDTLWKRHLRFEEEEKQRIKKENDRLLSLQSRITAEKANALIDNWPYDESKAARIALEVLPHNVDYPERPWVSEAEYILRRCITGKFNELSINDRGGIICYSDEFYVCEGVSGPVSIESNQNADYSVRIFDKSGNLFDSLDYGEHIISACLSSDNRILCLATQTAVFIHSIRNEFEDYKYEDMFSSIYKITKISPDNNLIACVSGHEIELINLTTKQRRKCVGHTKKIMSLEFSANGNLFVTSSLDCCTNVWNLSNLSSPLRIEHNTIVTVSSFTEDSSSIISALTYKDETKTVVVANDVNSGNELWSMPLDVKFSIYQLQILSSLNMLIAEDSGTICIYDLETSRKINHIIDSRNFRIDNINMILSIIKTGRQRIDYKLYTKKELIESCISRYGSHELNEADRTLYFLQ